MKYNNKYNLIKSYIDGYVDNPSVSNIDLMQSIGLIIQLTHNRAQSAGITDISLESKKRIGATELIKLLSDEEIDFYDKVFHHFITRGFKDKLRTWSCNYLNSVEKQRKLGLSNSEIEN